MKKNKEVSKPEIRLRGEKKENVQTGVNKSNVVLIAVACVIVGFILGATIAIFRTNREAKAAISAGEPERNRSGDYEGEMQLSKSILEKDPTNLAALIGLGNACFDTDRYQEAIDAYSRALAIDPKNPDVRTDMGIMYRKLARFDLAIDAFRQAARDDPKHLNSRFNLGIVLKYDKNDFQGAIQAWEEFLKLTPDNDRATMVKQEIQTMKLALPKNRKG